MAGAAASPARSPGPAVPSPPGSRICGTAHGRDRTPAEILPSTGSPCSPPGRADRENGHLTIEACSRALALHAPGQPAVPINTATSADTAGGSGLQYNTSTCTYAWKTLRARKGTCRQLELNLNDGSTHTAGFQS